MHETRVRYVWHEYQAVCDCGWHGFPHQTMRGAQVEAERHEREETER